MKPLITRAMLCALALASTPAHAQQAWPVRAIRLGRDEAGGR